MPGPKERQSSSAQPPWPSAHHCNKLLREITGSISLKETTIAGVHTNHTPNNPKCAQLRLNSDKAALGSDASLSVCMGTGINATHVPSTDNILFYNFPKLHFWSLKFTGISLQIFSNGYFFSIGYIWKRESLWVSASTLFILFENFPHRLPLNQSPRGTVVAYVPFGTFGSLQAISFFWSISDLYRSAVCFTDRVETSHWKISVIEKQKNCLSQDQIWFLHVRLDLLLFYFILHRLEYCNYKCPPRKNKSRQLSWSPSRSTLMSGIWAPYTKDHATHWVILLNHALLNKIHRRLSTESISYNRLGVVTHHNKNH